MGLESLYPREKLDPIDDAQAGRKVQKFGDDLLLIKTYHGQVYEDMEHPQYIRYQLISQSNDEQKTKEKTIIFNENDESHDRRRDVIIHTARVMKGVREKFLGDSE